MTNIGENWTCPFCNRPQTITDGQMFKARQYLNLKRHKYGSAGLSIVAVSCANPDCEEITLFVEFGQGEVHLINNSLQFKKYTPVRQYKLRPDSACKPQPDFIPLPLRQDYYEACAIRDLSPKAAATLSRRCIQGIIRDFCGISKNRLIDEINELKDRLDAGNAPADVTAEAVEAIDYVRSVGNIGAHMEKDIDLVVPVDPGEAQTLIELIELLFEEWYVAREIRAQRLNAVKKVADAKQLAKNQPPAGP